uniref:Uncharacterized protein n=1 Tax=Acrobeloides nanus TaxID=290746 RepID=A0A914DMM0_9BILA
MMIDLFTRVPEDLHPTEAIETIEKIKEISGSKIHMKSLDMRICIIKEENVFKEILAKFSKLFHDCLEPDEEARIHLHMLGESKWFWSNPNQLVVPPEMKYKMEKRSF